MYLRHFGLNEPPFSITPHPDFFYGGGERGDLLEALIYAVTQGEGIIKVSGEVGTGKTMLCRMLMEALPERIETIYIGNPSMEPDELLRAIAGELGLELPAEGRSGLVRRLQQVLVEHFAAGRQVVILVDEAQAMPRDSLEEIRLLSNLETGRYKLLQIILFGQPELDEALARKDLRQLRERITHGFELSPLTQKQIADYIAFRLFTAGYRGDPLFAAGTVALIFKASMGLTRRVNILADKCLLAAFAEGASQITRAHTKAAIRDVVFHRDLSHSGQMRQLWRKILMGLAIFMGLTIVVALVWFAKDFDWSTWLAQWSLHMPTLPFEKVST